MGKPWLLCFACFMHSSSAAFQVDRQKIDLQRDRLSAGYRRALDTAFDRFNIWCVVNSHPLPATLEHDAVCMNRLLVQYVRFLFDEQYGIFAGRHAVLAVQTKLRPLRGHLTQAWDSVKSLDLVAPISMRVPMPDLILQAMFVFAMVTGFQSTGKAARDWLSFGVGLLASFDALLRPGEFALLGAGKVFLPTSRLYRHVSRGLLTIVNGKNRRVFGRIQIAMCDSALTLCWLEWLTTGMAPQARLLPGGTSAFRRLFNLTLEALGLRGLNLTPASLRAGGATSRFAKGMDLSHLKWWGRWASLHTLEHSVQEAAASMVILDLEMSLLQRLATVCACGAVFETPPRRPWQSYFSRASQQLPARWTSTISQRRSAKSKP